MLSLQCFSRAGALLLVLVAYKEASGLCLGACVAGTLAPAGWLEIGCRRWRGQRVRTSRDLVRVHPAHPNPDIEPHAPRGALFHRGPFNRLRAAMRRPNSFLEAIFAQAGGINYSVHSNASME